MQQYLNFFFQHWVLTTLLIVIFLAIFVFEKFFYISNARKIITATESVNLINHENALVLDVRDRLVFKAGHIVNSVNIPMQDIEQSWNKLEQYKNRIIIVICQGGQRANLAANILTKHNFINVKVMANGISGWQQANLPLDK